MRETDFNGEEPFRGLQSTPRRDNDRLGPPPVTGECASPVLKDSDHQLERRIQRVLQELPGITFDSLVIRRLPSGVCLQGYATIEDHNLDLGCVAREIVGVGEVLDRIVAIRRPPVPPR